MFEFASVSKFSSLNNEVSQIIASILTFMPGRSDSFLYERQHQVFHIHRPRILIYPAA